MYFLLLSTPINRAYTTDDHPLHVMTKSTCGGVIKAQQTRISGIWKSKCFGNTTLYVCLSYNNKARLSGAFIESWKRDTATATSVQEVKLGGTFIGYKGIKVSCWRWFYLEINWVNGTDRKPCRLLPPFIRCLLPRPVKGMFISWWLCVVGVKDLAMCLLTAY